jgi:hypothetical protein
MSQVNVVLTGSGGNEVGMARKERDDIALVWGASGAVVLWRLAPGVLYMIGLGNFDGPFEHGPISDFDREIEAHGSFELFIDVRKLERGSRKSRGAWKEWASQNNARHRSHVLVRSSLLHMAISDRAGLRHELPVLQRRGGIPCRAQG